MHGLRQVSGFTSSEYRSFTGVSLVGYGNDASRKFDLETHKMRNRNVPGTKIITCSLYSWQFTCVFHGLAFSFYLFSHLIPSRRSSVLPPALAVTRLVRER